MHESLLYASSDGVPGTDHSGRYLPLTHVQQKLHVVPYYWNPNTFAYEVAQQASGGTGGGGGAATIADGADVAQGAKADAAWDGSASSASRIAIAKHAGGKLEAIRALLAGVLTIALPTGASTSAKQDTGNTSLASIDGKTPALGQALSAGSVPVVLTAAQLTALTPPAAITGFALDATVAKDGTDISAPTAMPAGGSGIRGWLSAIWTKLNGTLVVSQATPANLQATVTQGPAGAAAWLADVSDRAARVLGVITPPALTKGTQGATGFSTQDLKDSGRTRWSCATVIAGVAGVAAEAVLSMVVQRNSVPGAATTTQAVTAGKRLRLISLTVGIISTAAAVVSVRVVLRCNPTGAAIVTSPIELIVPIPSGAALAQAGGFITIPLPDGFEYSGTEQITLSHVGSVGTYTLWAGLNGYEY